MKISQKAIEEVKRVCEDQARKEEIVDKASKLTRHRTDEELWVMFECLGYQTHFKQILKDRVEREMDKRGLWNIYRDQR